MVFFLRKYLSVILIYEIHYLITSALDTIRFKYLSLGRKHATAGGHKFSPQKGALQSKCTKSMGGIRVEVTALVN